MGSILSNGLKIFFAFLALLSSISLQARQPYHATILVGSQKARVSAPNIVVLRKELRTTAIEELLPFYTPTSPAGINLNIRGIKALGGFAANSTAFTVNFPQIGITRTFDGGTRDNSLALFNEFLKEGGQGGRRLFRAYAKFSPIDPIAGNPNSLMAEMAWGDYSVGTLSPLSGCDCSWSSQPVVHQFQGGLTYGRSFTRGFDTTVFSAPLRYSYAPTETWAFIIDAPISLLKNGGAYSAVGSFGFGLRFPITSNWSLTPIARLGFGGSLDLVTAGSFVSGGITSAINFKLCDYVLTVTDYAGYITSTPLHLGGVNWDYRMYNTVFKNGLSLTSCNGYQFCSRPLHFRAFFIDTLFQGTSLYMNHYDEVGVAFFMTNVNPCIEYDCLSLGFTYMFGEKNYRGYYANLIYQF